MHILITAATNTEIQPAIDHLKSVDFRIEGHELEVLITGVGSLVTTYVLTHYIHKHRPEYIIQAGIGGSFSNEYPPPAIVLVEEEILADSGVEESGNFQDIFDLKIAEKDKWPFTDKRLVNPASVNWKKHGLPLVRGVTINEITTAPARIAELKRKYNPAIESMEGAALHYICLQEEIPFLQIRSISNFVGERNKSKWKMKEAIDRLNETLITLIPQLL